MEVHTYTTPPLDFAPTLDVASCYCTCEGKFLLLQSAEHKTYPGTWGAPGGKIDPGETPYEAALRELKEETGIELSSAHFFKTFYVRYPTFDFTYHVFYVELPFLPAITIQPEEHSAYLWASPRDLSHLPLFGGAAFCYTALYGEPPVFRK